MWKSCLSIVISVAILGFVGAGIARAQEIGPPGGPMMTVGPQTGGITIAAGPLPPPMMMVLRAANLTDAQKSQVHDIMDSNQKTTMPLMQQMHSVREQIADKLVAPGSLTTPDMAPLLTQQWQIQQQLDSQMVSTAIQIRGVLTPDQLTKVAAANAKLKQIHSEIQSMFGPPDAPPPP